MNATYSLIKSRTFWTLVVMGLIPVVNLFLPLLSPQYQAAIEPILGFLAAYFHKEGVQNAIASN